MQWQKERDLADSGWRSRLVVVLVELEAGWVHFVVALPQVLERERERVLVLLGQVVFVVVEMLADFVE